MGLKDFFKKKEERKQTELLTNTFKLLNGYTPAFTSYDGGLYEMALTRSCIDKIASQCSKMNGVVNAPRTYKQVKNLLKNPNTIMTSQQFLYRLVSILVVENNAFIVPIYDNQINQKIIGLYPVRSNGAKITKLNNQDYLIYKINNEEFSIEYDRVGHLRRHYYKKEFFGENNSALSSTMDLMHTQEKGIEEGIKSAASIRFLAQLAVIQKPKDIIEEQQRLKQEQLSVENNGGVLIFDNKYSKVEKVDSKPYTIDSDQMEAIKRNVFNYFNISEDVIQNKATEDSFNMFYEGVIEPIAIQLSQVLTKMLIKESDIEKGYEIAFESNRLQFVSNNTKLNVSQQLFDRGILSVNQVMDIWNLPHVPDDEDKRYIRKEYTDVKNLDKNELGTEEDKGVTTNE